MRNKKPSINAVRNLNDYLTFSVPDELMAMITAEEVKQIPDNCSPELLLRYAKNYSDLLKNKTNSIPVSIAVCQCAIHMLTQDRSKKELCKARGLKRKAMKNALALTKKDELDKAIESLGKDFQYNGKDFVQDMAKEFFKDSYIDLVAKDNKDLKDEIKALKEKQKLLSKENETLVSNAKAYKERMLTAERKEENTRKELNKEIVQLEHRLKEMEHRFQEILLAR